MKSEPSNRRELLGTLAVGGLAATALLLREAAATAAEDSSLDKAPAIVKKAAQRVVKGVKWDSATKNKDDDGHEYYELFGTHDKEMSASAEISTGGKVTSVELQIDLKDVPKGAMTAIGNRMTKFKPEHVLAMYDGDDIRDLSKAAVVYQLNGPAAKGKDLTVEITADGKMVEIKREIELADVPKNVSDVLANKAPKFKPETVHRITRDDKVAGFLFASKRGRVAWLSHDGKEFEIHKED